MSLKVFSREWKNNFFSYTLNCIKQNANTFLFYFLRLSCIHSSHSLRHRSLGLSHSSLTLRLRAQLFLSGRCPFFRVLHHGIQFSFHPASSIFIQLTVSQGLLFCYCSHIILPGLSLVWYSPILLIESVCEFLLSVVYFYSEGPPLSKIFYSMCGQFL